MGHRPRGKQGRVVATTCWWVKCARQHSRRHALARSDFFRTLCGRRRTLPHASSHRLRQEHDDGMWSDRGRQRRCWCHSSDHQRQRRSRQCRRTDGGVQSRSCHQRAHMCRRDPAHDLVARNIGKALGYDQFPVISLFAPNGNQLDEAFRMVGLWDAPTVLRELSKAMTKRGWLGPTRAPSLPPHSP